MSSPETPERPRTPKLCVFPATLSFLEERFPGWFTPPSQRRKPTTSQPKLPAAATSPGYLLNIDSPTTEERLAVCHLKLFGASPTPMLLSPLPTTPKKLAAPSTSTSSEVPLQVSLLTAASIFKQPRGTGWPLLPPLFHVAVKSATPGPMKLEKKEKSKHLNRLCSFHGRNGPVVMTRKEILAAKEVWK